SRAFDLMQSLEPSCVVVDVDYSGEGGYGFVRRLRVDGSNASAIPLAFLAQSSEKRSHLAGFLVGADVCVTKPFRVHDAVIQIGALVRMSPRLRTAQEWLKSRPVQKAFEGNLEHISIATVLSVLEMERRTGVFSVTSKKSRAEIDFVAGYAVRGIALGIRVSALGALQKMLEWKHGRFSFMPMAPRDHPPNTPQIGGLLLD